MNIVFKLKLYIENTIIVCLTTNKCLEMMPLLEKAAVGRKDTYYIC